MRELAENEVSWHGPCWLSLPEDEWPYEVLSEDKRCLDEASVKASCNLRITDQIHPQKTAYPFFSTRIQRWMKLLRVTAIILKWLKLRKAITSRLHLPASDLSTKSVQISVSELKMAEFRWIQIVHQAHFQEE